MINKSKFTKEFAVRGGKNIDLVYQPCEVVFTGNRFIVVRNEKGKEFSRKKSKIHLRDIDTRTEEEKEIHKAALLIDKNEDCKGLNVNISNSVSQRVVIETMIKAGYRMPTNKKEG